MSFFFFFFPSLYKEEEKKKKRDIGQVTRVQKRVIITTIIIRGAVMHFSIITRQEKGVTLLLTPHCCLSSLDH
jgi:hypothetical protein